MQVVVMGGGVARQITVGGRGDASKSTGRLGAMPGNQRAMVAARLADSRAAPRAPEEQLDGRFGRRHQGWEGQRRDRIGTRRRRSLDELTTGRHLRLLVVGLHRGLDGSFVWRGRRWDVQRHVRIDGEEWWRRLVCDLGLGLCVASVR